MAQTEKTNHKEYGGRQHRPEVFSRWLRMNRYHIDFDIATQGGTIKNKQGRPVGWLRGPFWRSVKDSPRVTSKDIRRIFNGKNPSNAMGDTGSELELNIKKYDGTLAPAMAVDGPIIADLTAHNHLDFVEEEDFDTELAQEEKYVGFSPELALSCVELNFSPGLNDMRRNRKILYALKKFISICEKNGCVVTPESVVSNKHLEVHDVNPHEYVQRIAFNWMGWEHVRHFVGSSFQTHVEMLDIESALKAVNVYQLVTPILYAGTLAGPFMGGSITPDLKKIYKNIPDIQTDNLKQTTYNALTPQSMHSFRYLGRFFGSPSGGVMRVPAPETQEEFWQTAEKQLMTQESPTVGRVTGAHTDFRIRPDLGPYGTIELATCDTMGAHIKKLIAMQEFTRALGWKLQLFAKFGKMSKLAQKYPALFGANPSRETYTQVHENMLEVSKNGNQAVITAMDNTRYHVGNLWIQLAEFVNEPIIDEERGIDYKGLPSLIQKELANSFHNPTELFTKYYDENGITSIQGFYETGVGTLSQWMQESTRQLHAKGREDEEIICYINKDLGKSFHQHVYQTHIEDIDHLYNMAIIAP